MWLQETYEPFWDELCACLKSHGVYIRSIWVADSSNQGASGILNEDIQGDNSMLKLSPSWKSRKRSDGILCSFLV